MLTIALFSHSPHLCGAERMLLNLAILLKRSGSVHPVLLSPGEGELTAETRRHGLHCELVPEPPWYLKLPISLNDYRRGVLACCESLRTMLVDLNSDAVLINTLTNVPAMLAAVELNLPSLVWVHGVIDSSFLPARSSEFTASHDELLLQCATRVIALSNYTSEFCARVMQRPHLDVISNWTPADPQFTAPPNKYRSRQFACLNTFDRHKGHGTLLQAAALLKARKIDFEVHLYGDGVVRGEMASRTVELNLQDCVRFKGRTTNVREVYDNSLGVVNPADAEPFGMTLIEAMARKTPVVATRSGGPNDIVIDGQCGYLVDRGDAAAMADRMRALLKSPELAQRLGEAGHARVCSRYSEAAARAAFLPIVEAAVAGFHGYDPVVKTLAKIHRLWLAMPVSEPAPSVFSSNLAARSMRSAARLTKGGLRHTRSLAQRMLGVLGLHRTAVSNSSPRPSLAECHIEEVPR